MSPDRALRAITAWPVSSAESTSSGRQHNHVRWTRERAFPGTPDQIWRVRAWVRSVLNDSPATDDIILVLSELSANAVTHSRSGEPNGRFIVRLQHVPGARVWGEVEDEGSSWRGDLRASARGSSGLFLVLNLASACGVIRGKAQNHMVWFRQEFSAVDDTEAAVND